MNTNVDLPLTEREKQKTTFKLLEHSISQSCLTLYDSMDCNLTGSSVHGIFQAEQQNTGASCHSLLQRIYLSQGSNLCLLSLLHWQEDSLPLAPPGKPTQVSSSQTKLLNFIYVLASLLPKFLYSTLQPQSCPHYFFNSNWLIILASHHEIPNLRHGWCHDYLNGNMLK